MKRTLLFVPIVMGLVVLAASAADLPDKLTVETERQVYQRYESVSGLVKDLDLGERFTVQLVDARGKVRAQEKLKRTGTKGTPYRLQIRSFSTSTMYLYAKGEKTSRSGIARIVVTPPDDAWTSVLVAVTGAGITKIGRADGYRQIGVGAVTTSTARETVDAVDVNLRTLVVNPQTLQGFGVNAADVQTSLDRFVSREKVDDFGALARQPSLLAPGILDEAVRKFGELAKVGADANPAGYLFVTSAGVTPNNVAVDYDFSEPALVAFRDHLKRQYAGVGVLTRTWDVKFRRWEEVRPLTAYEIVARESKNFERKRPLNFAAWVDHRRFCDDAFASRLADLVTRIRRDHMNVRLGLADGQVPAAYGGYDWSQLVDLFDFMECVDPLGKRMVASFNRRRFEPGRPFGTVSEAAGAPTLVRTLWTNVTSGDVGVLINPGANLVDAEGRPTPLGRDVAPALLALEGMGPVLAHKEFVPAVKGVFVWTSQASVRVQWMFDAVAAGASFRMGQRADGVWTSTWHRNLLAWVDLLDDLGIEFEFLPARSAVSRGGLRGVRVIILPKIVALSDVEIAVLDRFVENGGTLIADSQVGIFDEHGVQRKTAGLDRVFGISRDENEHPAELAAEFTPVVDTPMRVHKEQGRFRGLAEDLAADTLAPVEKNLEPRGAGYHLKTGRTHAVLTRTQGKGATVYLNLSLINYPWERTEVKHTDALRTIVRRTFDASGITSDAAVAAVPGKDFPDLNVRQFNWRKNSFVFLVRNTPPPKAPPARPMTVLVTANDAEPYVIGARRLDLEGVTTLLTERKEYYTKRGTPLPSISIEADEGVLVKAITDVAEACKAAGFTAVSFGRGIPPEVMAPPEPEPMPPPPEEMAPPMPPPPMPPEPAPAPGALLPGVDGSATFLAQDAPAEQVPAPLPPVPAPVEPAPAPETPAPEPERQPVAEDYKVKPRDIITVGVAGQADLTKADLVATDGTLDLKLVGKIKVEGLTRAEIVTLLMEKYGQYVVGVNVSVIIAPAPPAAEVPPEETPEKPVELKGDFVQLKLDRERFVYDVLLGMKLGTAKTDKPLVYVPAGGCGVLSVLDYEVTGIDITVTQRPQEVLYRLKLKASDRPELHTFRVQFFDPKGNEAVGYRALLAAPGGDASGALDLAVNEPNGEWKLKVTDVLTGVSAETKFEIK